MTQTDVVLVNMPFADVQRPSIALGLLHASLDGTGIRSEVVYANFGLAEAIGLVAYQAMQSAPTDHLLGEWCFAGSIFPEDAEKDEAYLNLILEVRCNGFPATLEQRKDLMRWVRAKCGEYLGRLAEAVVARGPRVVGCSSVFQQHCASLALLKRVRELSPETVLLMGGANCEGEMGVETLRSFPWVDCAVSGEADALFPDLCRLLLERGRAFDPDALPSGAMAQAGLKKSALPVLSSEGVRPPPEPPRALIRDMDALPTPNYDHYFETLRASTLSNLVHAELLAESSRGCWWGEKSHCTFCGLNGTGMKYRSKSPGRVVDELGELTRRYGNRSIQFVDNILDMSFFKTVLPALADSAEKYAIFYETKSNLKREQVKLLAEAGVRWIQPGIESLHDGALALIGKGNSAVMNLQLLKWSCEFGVDASWNLLCGLPGESDAWYFEMAGWLPAIFHLQPPTGVIRVRYDRFSPYQMRPQDYGLTLEPSRTYSYVYPFPKETLMRLAYSFEDEGDAGHVHRGLHDRPGHVALQDEVLRWNHLWQTSRPVLQVYDEGRRLRFVDTRPCAVRGSWTAGELESEVYRACDSAQTPSSLLKRGFTRGGTPVSTREVEQAIESLRRAKVLVSLSGKLLAVGVSVARAGL